ncbi:MAG: hypothetical protein JWP97_311 [Labilithrix sp.]|nr:hypothetical protein [Labilithrix sp.]
MRPSAVVVGISALIVGVLAAPALARADVQHTIGRGHTIEAIANRYHVTAKAIIEANHLKDVRHLKVGDVLVIPGVKEPAAAKAKPDAKEARAEDVAGHKKGDRSAKVGGATGRETTTFAMKPRTPGVIHVHRVATQESYDVDVGDKKGRVSPTTLKTFEKMMRSPSGMAHPIEPRLVALLGVVSNHFGSRKLEVVSGFRPFTPTQYNPHSNHMHGKAVDFRIAGVPNEAVRDFCRTLKNVGCGYYPNSVFVHMDVRDQSTFWIDYSKPGETPRYNAPDTNADEGTSDVSPDAPAATSTESVAPETPAPPPDTGDN